MAARRIKAALCPEPAPKRSSYPFNNQAPSRERKPIPGWTDGSDAWRSSVYSISSVDSANKQAVGSEERASAYRSFPASPHRSVGVYSTLSENTTPVASHAPAPADFNASMRSKTQEEVSSNYPLTFVRRTDSRTSLSGASPQSLPMARRKEHSLVMPGAEGMLLVPNVKLRSHSAASSHSGGTSSVSSCRSGSTRSLVKSPLSRRGSQFSEEGTIPELPEPGEVGSLPAPKRPVIESESHALCVTDLALTLILRSAFVVLRQCDDLPDHAHAEAQGNSLREAGHQWRNADRRSRGGGAALHEAAVPLPWQGGRSALVVATRAFVLIWLPHPRIALFPTAYHMPI